MEDKKNVSTAAVSIVTRRFAQFWPLGFNALEHKKKGISVEFVGGLILLVIFIVIIRRFGAWMMRIDEVIALQEETLKELRVIRKGVRGKSGRVEEFLDKRDNASE